MRKPHKHAELIKAWADGADIEIYRAHSADWIGYREGESFLWDEDYEYRIKPEPKPDTIRTYSVEWNINNNEIWWHIPAAHNLKLTFDGETGKLKSVEVI